MHYPNLSVPPQFSASDHRLPPERTNAWAETFFLDLALRFVRSRALLERKISGLSDLRHATREGGGRCMQIVSALFFTFMLHQEYEKSRISITLGFFDAHIVDSASRLTIGAAARRELIETAATKEAWHKKQRSAMSYLSSVVYQVRSHARLCSEAPIQSEYF